MMAGEDFKLEAQEYCSVHKKYHKAKQCPQCKQDSDNFMADLARSSSFMRALDANPASTAAPTPTSAKGSERAADPRPQYDGADQAPPPLPRCVRAGHFVIWEVKNRTEMLAVLAAVPDDYRLAAVTMVGGIINVITEPV